MIYYGENLDPVNYFIWHIYLAELKILVRTWDIRTWRSFFLCIIKIL